MIQATVKDLLQGELDHIELSGVYIVRDGEHVLYVGRSIDVIQRLHDHYEKWTSSAIGDVIHTNAPQPYTWQLELFEPEECRAIVASQYSKYNDTTNLIDIELAEVSTIVHYHPCLNTSNNPKPNRLPKHIKRYPVEIRPGATDNLF